MSVWVHKCGVEYKAKQNGACFPFGSDSACRYNYLFNTVTPYYVTFYDFLAKACSVSSAFPSGDHFLTCFIAGKWQRHLLSSQTIKYCLAQIPSWNIKQNECCSFSFAYHIILKMKTYPLVFFPDRRDIGKNEFSLPFIRLALSKASNSAIRKPFQSCSFSKAIFDIPFKSSRRIKSKVLL